MDYDRPRAEIWAAGVNNLPEVRRLLSVGADENVNDNYDGETPLIVASFHGHLPWARARSCQGELLEHDGAAIEEEDLKVGGLYTVPASRAIWPLSTSC
jgi:ankyrin repeat protein